MWREKRAELLAVSSMAFFDNRDLIIESLHHAAVATEELAEFIFEDVPSPDDDDSDDEDLSEEAKRKRQEYRW